MIYVFSGARDGSRDKDVRELIDRDDWPRGKPSWVIAGGATGVDAVVKDVCEVRGIRFVEVPAAWKHSPRHAGPTRNGWMLDLAQSMANSRSIVCMAFPGKHSAGTWDFINQTRSRWISLEIV